MTHTNKRSVDLSMACKELRDAGFSPQEVIKQIFEIINDHKISVSTEKIFEMIDEAFSCPP